MSQEHTEGYWVEWKQLGNKNQVKLIKDNETGSRLTQKWDTQVRRVSKWKKKVIILETQKYIRKRARKITSIQNNLSPEYKCKYMGTETKYLRLQIQRRLTIKNKNKYTNKLSKNWMSTDTQNSGSTAKDVDTMRKNCSFFVLSNGLICSEIFSLFVWKDFFKNCSHLNWGF